MLLAAKRYFEQKRRLWNLPSRAKEQMRRDRNGLADIVPQSVSDIERASLEWLCRAQDCSKTRDGGVARDFSLINGWSSSYPETTGYIVPTMLDGAARYSSSDLSERARRMLDWLVSIQMPSGGFQGGKVDSTPVVPVTFNTGQILLGLARGEHEFGGYREPMQRAGDWLVSTLDDDGCWRRYPTPFAQSGEKCYETHVAWGLFEAARFDTDRGYAEAAEANVRWALRAQRANGWFEKCCLEDPERPLTHTIGYAIRGILEAYRFTGNHEFLEAAIVTSDGVLSALRQDGFLPGRLNSDWSAAVNWNCLTGAAQIAYCWLIIYEVTKREKYWHAASLATQFVARTVSLGPDPDIRGGVKGAYPVYGDYGSFEYLNWASKFLVDVLAYESSICAKEGVDVSDSFESRGSLT